MGRPRTFDEMAVLDAAAAEFRVHGFAETSTEQLCEASGLRRSSLYNAFTSKEELYVLALQRYTETVRERQVAILEDADRTGAERITAFLDLIVDEERTARERGHAAGCMTLQTLMTPDLREREDRLQEMLERDQRERLSLLEATIAAGQRDGSLHTRVSARDGALLIITVVGGLRSSAQAGIDPATLRTIGLHGLASLFT